MEKNVKRLKQKRDLALLARVGSEIICPSCGTKHIKKRVDSVFDKRKCKDNYWNNVTPSKRNNTTRISPANAANHEQYGKKRYTTEGYEIRNGVAYDEFDDPIYDLDE